MLQIPDVFLQSVILPLMSAQLFLMVALYFTFVGRHVVSGVKFFNFFIATYILYLIGHCLQLFSDVVLAYSILYFRISLFLTIGLPSLLLFLCVQCGIKLQKYWCLLPYFFGGVMSAFYFIGSDSRHLNFVFDSSYTQILPFTFTGANHIDAEMMALIVLSLAPASYLLYHELRMGTRKTCVAFLSGTLIISFLYIVGLYYRAYWLYNFGAMLTALYWVWSVYDDVRQTKSQVQSLKEELQLFARDIHSGQKIAISSLLDTIESDSRGNINRYKLKVREILDTLTDTTIQAGGDADSLLARNLNRIEVILKSDDTNAIRDIATKETADLTSMIYQLPVKRSEKIIEDTKVYIENHYQNNIEVSALAESANVSQSYLMRCFKKETGMTIKQYLTQCRIDKAKSLLEGMTVAEAAFAVGYNDSNYFGNVFKKLSGVGPQQYKKEHYS